MPVNDNSLGAELVGEVDVDDVPGLDSDSRARELAVDGHHRVLKAVGRPEPVLDIPFKAVDGRTGGQSRPDCGED